MSTNNLVIYKDRTNTVTIHLGIDVSDDVITSQIREGKVDTSELIAEWEVSFVTDGEDGDIYVTLDDSDLSDITQTRGYMDIKRVSGGEPVPVLASPIKVRFIDSITE